jgi:hypothetical protein
MTGSPETDFMLCVGIVILVVLGIALYALVKKEG